MTWPGTTTPFFTTGTLSTAPTATAALCGSVMMAVNSSTPYMPRLETVKVPRPYSSGLSLPSLARRAFSLTSRAIVPIDFSSARWMSGAIRPSSMATATEIAISSGWRMPSPWKTAFRLGCLRRARAQALMIMSLTEILSSFSRPSFSCVRSFMAASMSTAMVT